MMLIATWVAARLMFTTDMKDTLRIIMLGQP
jgi:hypothetical protein